MDAFQAIQVLEDGAWWDYLPDSLPDDIRHELVEAIDFAELQIKRMMNTRKRVVVSEHHAGICPSCGGSLIYAISAGELSGTPESPSVDWGWTCSQCKATGTERHPAELGVTAGVEVVNVGGGLVHCNVTEADGTEIELRKI